MQTLTVLALILLSTAARGQRSGSGSFEVAGTDESAVRAFLQTLQDAVHREDKGKVASLGRYPLHAWTQGRTVELKAARDFVAQYDRIMTPHLKRVIAAASVENVFANWKGVMIHHGELWFAPAPEELRIIRINPPVAPGPR